MFEKNTKAIALLSGQNSLIFITFQCSINLNQFQIWSFLSKIPRLQPYFFGQKSLIFITFQCSIKINQFQIWSCCEQNTKAIALLFGQKSLIFITCQCSIKINQFQIWSFLSQIPRLQPYFLAKNRSFSSLINVQSKSISFKFGHF